ncbi:MAG: hypothetical protein WBA41_10325 [Rivularia sp. (in: cyanobacteria)]
MTNRKHTSNQQTKEDTQDLSTTSMQGMFQPRPFVMQAQTADRVQQPDLNTSLTQAKHYGHHLNQINASVSKPEALQPKMQTGKPVQLAKRKRNKPATSSAGGNSTGQSKRQKTSSKQKSLEEEAEKNPDKTPMQILEKNPDWLVGKGDPHKSGEHSPSVVNLNKATDNKMLVTGRDNSKHKQGQQVNSTIAENKIPTMHFQSISGKQIVPGKEAHSITTSLRAAAGVGEHTKQSFDQVLDKTLSAYPGAKLLSNNQPMKVDVRQKGAQKSLVRHPVSPRIAQSAINIWHRNTVSDGKPRESIL